MKKKAYEKNIEMSNNNDSTTGNLLDFTYFKKKKKKKLIAIDLSRKTKLKDPQQIILLENFQEIMEQQGPLLFRNQKKLVLIFHTILSQLYK